MRTVIAAILIALALSQPGLATHQGFIPNAGQFDAEALFVARSGGLTTWITDHGMRLQAGDQDGRRTALFLEAEQPATIDVSGLEPLSMVTNHYIGIDPATWVEGVRSVGTVLMRGIRPGIDLRCHALESGMEYDVELAPGVDLDSLVFHCRGASVSLQDDQTLRLDTEIGPILQTLPATWEVASDGTRRELHARFRPIDGARFGFTVEGRDPAARLVIDPVLKWSAYVGANGQEEVRRVDVENGRVFLAGYTSSLIFPVTPGAYDVTPNGDRDAYLMRVSDNGQTVAFATYFGGSQEDLVFGLDADEGSSVLPVVMLGGQTRSANFPTTPGVHDQSFGPFVDNFVARFNQDTGALVWSTYVGSATSVDLLWDLVEYGDGAFVIGQAYSGFPVTGAAYDTTFNGGNGDIVVYRLSSTGNMVASTFLGGSGVDYPWSIATNGTSVYVMGTSESTDFPIAGAPFQNTYKGGLDIVFARLNISLSTLELSGYLGGSNQDNAGGIDVDANGNIYLGGYTISSDFPALNGFDVTYQGGPFVTRLTPTGALYSSTFVGQGDCFDLTLDAFGRVHIAGRTAFGTFPVTPNAADSTLSGFRDAFLAVLDPKLAELRYATYFGATNDEIGLSVAVDPAGDAYLAGQTDSFGLQYGSGSFDISYAGGDDGFVVRLPTRTCATTPSSVKYGTGKAGTFGTPSLSDTSPPTLGTFSGIRLTNGKPGAMPTLVLGAQQLNLKFDCGKLLCSPDILLVIPVPIAADGTLEITAYLPEDPVLCGFTLYHQMWFVDPGAPCYYHTAQTNGLARTFGSL